MTTATWRSRARILGFAAAFSGAALLAVSGASGQGAPEDNPELFDALMSEGEGAYNSNCAGCHGADGGGGAGPTLAGNDYLASVRSLVGQTLAGNPDRGMPPFAGLSDREIAALTTYARNSWGNAYGLVLEETVSAYR